MRSSSSFLLRALQTPPKLRPASQSTTPWASSTGSCFTRFELIACRAKAIRFARPGQKVQTFLRWLELLLQEQLRPRNANLWPSRWETYARQLHEKGYAVQSGALQLRLLGCFNRWLRRRKLRSENVDTAVIAQYLRGRAPSVRRGDSAALSRLLTILQPNRSTTVAPPPSAVEIALGRFQQYLRQEPSLTEATVINYTPTVRAFLLERFPEDSVDCQQITAGEITAFVAAHGYADYPQARSRWW